MRADDDWVDIELPYVFGLIGPGAIPHVTDFLADRSVTTEPLITVIKCLKEIAEKTHYLGKSASAFWRTA